MNIFFIGKEVLGKFWTYSFLTGILLIFWER